MRTAGSLAETAEPYVEESFKRNLSRIRSGEQDGGIITIRDESKSSTACESDVDTATDDARSSLGLTIAVPPLGVRSSPFHGLILYVFRKAKGKIAILPTTVPSGLSTLHREMYVAALEELTQPGPVVNKKDVLVLLSTIINTLPSCGRRFSISKSIMEASQLPGLDRSSDSYNAVKSMLRELLLALHSQIEQDRHCPPDFAQLKNRVWTLMLDTAEKTACYTVLQIVNQILLWIELDMFAPPTSEHVYVSAWSLLFNILLLGTNIRAIPGELVSKASTNARQRTESTFGSTTSTPCGRKVDMSIRIRVDNRWMTEIAVFEFKSSTASPETCRKQQKKSVRLNAAILLELESRGLNINHSYPVIAEGQALGLNFYTLRRYGDVLGAGKATEKAVALPSQVEHLKAFFESDAIFTLLAFKEHLRRYAVDVTDTLAISVPTPFGNDSDDSSNENDNPPPIDIPAHPGTPPPMKRNSPLVLFSPSSKRDKKDIQDHHDVEDDDTEEDEL